MGSHARGLARGLGQSSSSGKVVPRVWLGLIGTVDLDDVTRAQNARDCTVITANSGKLQSHETR